MSELESNPQGDPADFWGAVERIRERDDRLEAEVYAFIMQALDHTIRRIGERRHVSAAELLDGFCEHGRDRFGLLAHDVIRKWGITRASDVGRAVFQLVDAGVLSKQDSDRAEDFEIEYDFEGALEARYFD